MTCLLGGETVAYHLEYIGEGGQGKHQHDHAPGAGGDLEEVIRVGQVIQEVAVELVLGLLLETDAHVQIGEGLAGHQALEEVRRWPPGPGVPHHKMAAGYN